MSATDAVAGHGPSPGPAHDGPGGSADPGRVLGPVGGGPPGARPSGVPPGPPGPPAGDGSPYAGDIADGGDIANAEQARAWDGTEGAYWARNAARFEATTAAYDRILFDAAGIRPGMRVLDVGCGSGATTREAARRAAPGQVVGVDLSAAMIDVARGHGTPGAVYLRADAQVHPFADAAFDVVVSRTGASFFADPSAAFANLARAMRPGARMALLTWRRLADNAWAREILTALTGSVPSDPPPGPGPFGLADRCSTRDLLAAAGLNGVQIGPESAPLVFGRNPDDALELVTGLFEWLLPPAGTAERSAVLDTLRAVLTRHHGPDGVALPSAAWLVTAVRP